MMEVSSIINPAVNGGQSESPGPTNVTGRPDFAELLVMLQYARRGCWVFALYNHLDTRQEITAAIKNAVAPMPVFEWTYTIENPYPISYLQQLTEAQRQARAVVFLFGLERAEAEVWKSLDFNREEFAAHPHGLVFWLTANGRADAARYAPHFWAQRSSVYDFSVAIPRLQIELEGGWVDKGVSAINYDDALNQLRLYQNLYEKNKSNPDASLASLAGVAGKIAWLLDRLERRDEALPYVREECEFARRLNDAELQAEAMIDLAQVERFHSGPSTSIAILEQAIALITTPRLRAYGLLNLGALTFNSGQTERGFSLLKDAFEKFKQTEDKPGQAYALKAIGDAQLLRNEIDRARESYDRALRFFTKSQDTPGQAKVLKALGDVQALSMESDAAMESYFYALNLFTLLGNKAWREKAVQAIAELESQSGQKADSISGNWIPVDETTDFLSRQTSPYEEVRQQQLLKKVWDEIKVLPVNQRRALLLNLRDERGETVTGLLPMAGIASMRQIADALEMPAEDFAKIWGELPLDDAAIADLISATRQQVINLRKSARMRLARGMKALT